MSGPMAVTGWRVTGTSEATDLNEANQFVKGVLVNFTTGRGHQGSLFVPLPMATPENVRRMVVDRVAAIEAISDLSHEA